MPDREYIADVFERLKSYRLSDGTYAGMGEYTGSVRSLSQFLRKTLQLSHSKFKEQENFGRVFNSAIRFLELLDRESVEAIEAAVPEFAGFFSKLPGVSKSFGATCEEHLRTSEPGELYCEASQKGDHTLIDLIPLLHCFLRANESNKIFLINKSETEETGFAYALLLGLRSKLNMRDSVDDVIAFVSEEVKRRKLRSGSITISEEAVSWLRSAVYSVRLDKRITGEAKKGNSDIITKIADLHPASLIGIERGNRLVSYLFYTHTPIQYDPKGEDQKNIFHRFKLIIKHARDEKIDESEKYFREVTLEDESVAELIRNHLTSSSAKIFDAAISNKGNRQI